MTTLEQLAYEALGGVSISFRPLPSGSGYERFNSGDKTLVIGTVRNDTEYRLIDPVVWTEVSGFIRFCSISLPVGGAIEINGDSWDELQPGGTHDFAVTIKGVGESDEVEEGCLKAYISAEVVPSSQRFRVQFCIDVYPAP